MWSEEEQRDITDYEVKIQTTICPACSSRQSKYVQIRERGVIPCVKKKKYCQECGHALE